LGEKTTSLVGEKRSINNVKLNKERNIEKKKQGVFFLLVDKAKERII